MSLLDTFYLYVTQRCNLDCDYCYFKVRSPISNELSTSEMIAVLQDVSLLKPKRIVFTGGEPLLRKDLIQLGQAFKDIGIEIRSCLQTNGTLITEKNAVRLVKYFDEIRISIDGLEPINDALRGTGTFKKVMNAFWYINQVGGDPRAFITVSSFNLPYLKELMLFLLNHGIVKIHLSPLRVMEKTSDETVLFKREELKRIMVEFWRETLGIQLKSEKKEEFNCGVGKFITVYPDGSIYPCHLLAFPKLCIGNVKEVRLSDLYLHSYLMNKLRKLDFRELAQCKECFKGLLCENQCLGSYTRERGLKEQLVDFLID